MLLVHKFTSWSCFWRKGFSGAPLVLLLLISGTVVTPLQFGAALDLRSPDRVQGADSPGERVSVAKEDDEFLAKVKQDLQIQILDIVLRFPRAILAMGEHQEWSISSSDEDEKDLAPAAPDIDPGRTLINTDDETPPTNDGVETSLEQETPFEDFGGLPGLDHALANSYTSEWSTEVVDNDQNDADTNNLGTGMGNNKKILEERNRGRRNKLSYDRLLLLAQAEAQCLEDFGATQQPPNVFRLDDDLIQPFKCDLSRHPSRCKQCQQLTEELVDDEKDCKQLCGNATWACAERCKDILKALHEQETRSLPHSLHPPAWESHMMEDVFNISMRSATDKFAQVFCESIEPPTGRLWGSTNVTFDIPVSISVPSELSDVYTNFPGGRKFNRKRKRQHLVYVKTNFREKECSQNWSPQGSQGQDATKDNEDAATSWTSSIHVSHQGSLNVDITPRTNYSTSPTRSNIESKDALQTRPTFVAPNTNETAGNSEYDNSKEMDAIKLGSDVYNSSGAFIPAMNSNDNLEMIPKNKFKRENRTGFFSKPVVYVLEQREMLDSMGKIGNRIWSPWKTLRKTSFSMENVPVAYLSKTYQWRFTAVNSQGVLDRVTSSIHRTFNGYMAPQKPKKVFVIHMEVYNGDSLSALVGWEPSKDRACFWTMIVETFGTTKSSQTVIVVNEPVGVHRFWIFPLTFDTQYGMHLSSRNGMWVGEESQPSTLLFRTPTCLQAHDHSFQKCVPPPPENVSLTVVKFVRMSTSIFGVAQYQWVTKFMWTPPMYSSDRNMVEGYFVRVTSCPTSNPPKPKVYSTGPAQHSFAYIGHEDAVEPFWLSGNETEISIQGLLPNTNYQLLVYSLGWKGSSEPALKNFILKPLEQPTTAVFFNFHVSFMLIIFLLFSYKLAGMLIRMGKSVSARDDNESMIVHVSPKNSDEEDLEDASGWVSKMAELESQPPTDVCEDCHRCYPADAKGLRNTWTSDCWDSECGGTSRREVKIEMEDEMTQNLDRGIICQDPQKMIRLLRKESAYSRPVVPYTVVHQGSAEANATNGKPRFELFFSLRQCFPNLDIRRMGQNYRKQLEKMGIQTVMVLLLGDYKKEEGRKGPSRDVYSLIIFKQERLAHPQSQYLGIEYVSSKMYGNTSDVQSLGYVLHKLKPPKRGSEISGDLLNPTNPGVWIRKSKLAGESLELLPKAWIALPYNWTKFPNLKQDIAIILRALAPIKFVSTDSGVSSGNDESMRTPPSTRSTSPEIP